MPKQSHTTGRQSREFRGFEHLTANYVYCPNQFFDVCLPHCSRGAVRLVAYLLRRTLGWLDENGEPVEQHISVSYQDLITHARISRRAIRQSVDEAVAAGFIERIGAPCPKSSGQGAQSGQYALRWDGEAAYVSNLEEFGGFYSGEGHRSPIPNAFFDRVVPYERLAVVKVVGTVLRHTVGYQNQFGGRRSQAPLSYSYIQKTANMRHRPTLAAALRGAVACGYICCAEPGCFDRDAGRNSRPTCYAVKWLDDVKEKSVGAETEPGSRNGAKTEPETVQKPNRRISAKTEPDRKTVAKDTLKQAVENVEGFSLLLEEGIREKAARKLSQHATVEEIEQQIAWLDFRNPSNRPAMLKTAIEEKWVEPEGFVDRDAEESRREREAEENAKRIEREAAIAQQKQTRLERRTRLLARWERQRPADKEKYRQMAAKRASSDVVKRSVLHCNLDEPTLDVLEAMAKSVAEPIGESS